MYIIWLVIHILILNFVVANGTQGRKIFVGDSDDTTVSILLKLKISNNLVTVRI